MNNKLELKAAVIMITLSLGSLAAFGQTAPPYPPSPVIENIVWDQATYVTAAAGSDIWPVTWGADGHLYTCWGDGNGFGATDYSWGVARITGIPPAWSGQNLFGKSRSDPDAGKSTGLICVDGVIYLWLQKQGDWKSTRIVKSSDNGGTWSMGPYILEYPLNQFTPIQFGQNYLGARDNYIYGYCDPTTGAGSTNHVLFLARVPKTGIEVRSAYQVFAGLDAGGAPIWSNNLLDRQPVFTDSNGNVNWGKQAVYSPVLKRYLLSVSHGGPDGEGPGLGIFDAPEPWGPWTTVHYTDAWKDNKNKFCFSFPQKWMSADGKSGWMIHSGWPEYDGYHHVKYTLTLKAADATPPTAPSGLVAAQVAGPKINLAWNAAADAESGISGYKIYRGTAPGGETLLAQVGNVTSYTDNAVAPLTTYYYKVSALNGAGLEGARSNEASATTGDGPPPPSTLTVFSTVGDGQCRYAMPNGSGPGQAQWDTAHNAATGNWANYQTAACNLFATTVYNGTDNAIQISRGFLVFDTSALPDDAVITGATVKVFITGKMNSKNDGNDFITVVEGRQASTSKLITSDYMAAGNAVHNVTEGSNRIDITGITTNAYTAWTLNQTGLTWISKNGWTKLAMREGHDVLDVWAGYAAGQGNGINAYMSEQAGTAQDPVLVITYTMPAANLPPVARISATPTSGDAPLAVAFDGSASSDPDGTIVSYSWDFGDGQNASGSQVNHIYVNPGNYIATLYVTDDKGAIASASTTISAIRVNQIPVAVAGVQGPGQTVSIGTQVTLTGAGSFDSDNYPSGGIQSYAWQQTGGPAVTLQNANGVNPTFTPSAAGAYTFKLVVNDGQAASTDASSPNNTISITVTADTTPPVLDVTSVVLKGTVGDADSGVASVTVNGQPAAVNGGDWEKEMPISPGVNTFTVVVTDNEGNQTTRQVQVTK